MTTITRIDRWQEFADATLDRRPEAGRMGRELAAQTPPVVLAKRARHRKMAHRGPFLPLWAGALVLAFQALREMEGASERQAGGGAS